MPRSSTNTLAVAEDFSRYFFRKKLVLREKKTCLRETGADNNKIKIFHEVLLSAAAIVFLEFLDVALKIPNGYFNFLVDDVDKRYCDQYGNDDANKFSNAFTSGSLVKILKKILLYNHLYRSMKYVQAV